MPTSLYRLAKVPVREGCAVLQVGTNVIRHVRLPEEGICPRDLGFLGLYHLGTHERQVNPLTAYAMLSVLEVPKGEWLAQACALPWNRTAVHVHL